MKLKRTRRVFDKKFKQEVARKVFNKELSEDSSIIDPKSGYPVHLISIRKWVTEYIASNKYQPPKNPAPKQETNPWNDVTPTLNTLKSKLSEYIIKSTNLEVENMELKSRLDAVKPRPAVRKDFHEALVTS